MAKTKELEHVNSELLKRIKELEVMNDLLRRKVSELQLTNSSLIKLIGQSKLVKPSSAQIISHSKNPASSLYLQITPSEVEKLVNEKASAAIQLDRTTAKLNEALAENKMARKLLQEYRTASFKGKHIRVVTEGNLNHTTSIADTTSDNKSVSGMAGVEVDKLQNNGRRCKERAKMASGLDRWYKLYQLIEYISGRKNYKDILIASIT